MMLKSLMAGAGVLALSTGLAAAVPATVETDLNVRSGPGLEYEVIGAMPAGATVDVMGCEANWCRVAYAGGAGFASRSYLGLGSASIGVRTYGAPYAGYDEEYAYSGYPGYAYSYGDDYGSGYYGGRYYGDRYRTGVTVGVSDGSFENRGFREGAVREGNVRADIRAGTETNARIGARERVSTRNRAGAEERQAAAIGGNNPMRNERSSASSRQVRPDERAATVGGNNPMRNERSTSAASEQSNARVNRSSEGVRGGANAGANTNVRGTTTGAARRSGPAD